MTNQEIADLRQRIKDDQPWSVEELAAWIAQTRVSFTADKSKAIPKNSKAKQPPTEEKQIDFF